MVGVFREPFISEAFKSQHPVDMESATPSTLRDNARWMLEVGPVEVAKVRLNALRELTKLIQDNAEADAAVLSSLSPSQQRVLAGKKLYTLGQLAERIHHPDKTLVSEASQGFKITGFQPYTGYFQERINMPTISEAQLQATAQINNESLLRKTGSAGSAKLDNSLGQHVRRATVRLVRWAVLQHQRRCSFCRFKLCPLKTVPSGTKR